MERSGYYHPNTMNNPSKHEAPPTKYSATKDTPKSTDGKIL